MLSPAKRVRGLESRPSRARGLKQQRQGAAHHREVAPFTGAWIETYSRPHCFYNRQSRPSRARGLKPVPIPSFGWLIVAPFTGAWIETV